MYHIPKTFFFLFVKETTFDSGQSHNVSEINHSNCSIFHVLQPKQVHSVKPLLISGYCYVAHIHASAPNILFCL